MAAMCSLPGVMFYIVVYGAISGVLMRRLYKLKIMCFEDFRNFHHHEAGSVFMVFLDFMSLGGLPVLPGFLPKVVVLAMMGIAKKIGMFFLIVSSVISLFYYLKVAMVAGVGRGLNFYLVHKWRGSSSGKSVLKNYVLFRAGIYFLGIVGLIMLVGVMSFSSSILSMPSFQEGGPNGLATKNIDVFYGFYMRVVQSASSVVRHSPRKEVSLLKVVSGSLYDLPVPMNISYG